MNFDAHAFLAELRGRVSWWGGAEWIAERVDGDWIVVLYRQYLTDRDEPVGLIEGARLYGPDFVEDAVEGDVTSHVSIDAILEIVEPHELGRNLDVNWADGLVARPRDVLWHGSAVDYATAEPT